MFTARFDDLRPNRRRSFSLLDAGTTLAASRPEEVAAVLEAAEDAVAAGKWVAGWVSYEAAVGLGGEFVTHPAMAGLPLVWLGVFDERAPGERAAGTYRIGEWSPTEDAGDHRAAVETVRRHIRGGHVYQVNHTFRLSAPFSGDAATFYDDLARSQAGGYAGFIDAGDWVVASASPEAFFELHGRTIMTKPMKGTAARGATTTDDEARRATLLASEKDRAENVMIVDMARNDLGRVAEVGSVRVPHLLEAEKYDTVWQLTSTVEGRLRPDVGLVDVFAAMFPAASITGAPKLAAMNVIADLETTPRGVYTGAIGFGGPGPGGEPMWAFNVGIRTVTIDRASGLAWYGTGGGITYDSDPSAEYREALLKTEVLARRGADFALLETMRWTPGDGYHLLDRHLARLRRSAEYFEIPLDEDSISSGLAAVVGDQPARVRLTVDRDGSALVESKPLPPVPPSPVTLAIDHVPVRAADPFLHHKTTRRGVYEEAALRHPGADDVVLVNEDGEVTETTVANLAVLVDGVWRTPPESSGCLPGVERGRLLAEGALVERPITVEELRSADDLARINALRGWEPAVLA